MTVSQLSTGLKIFGWFFFFEWPNWKRVTIFFGVFPYSKCLPRGYHWWHAAPQDRALLHSFSHKTARPDRRRRVSPRLGCSNCLCVNVYGASRDTLCAVTQASIQTRWSRSFAPGTPQFGIWILNTCTQTFLEPKGQSRPQCLPFWLRA